MEYILSDLFNTANIVLPNIEEMIEDAKKKNINGLKIYCKYKFPDSKVRRLYIMSPYIPLDASGKKNDEIKFYAKLSDPKLYAFTQTLNSYNSYTSTSLELLIEKHNLTCVNTLGNFNIANNNPRLKLNFIKKAKTPDLYTTEIIKYNVGKAYQPIEIYKEYTLSDLLTSIYGWDSRKNKPRIDDKRESRFIFSPYIWISLKDKTFGFSIKVLKLEVRFNDARVRSIIDRTEVTMTQVVKSIEI